jgi:hypothetical protein
MRDLLYLNKVLNSSMYFHSKRNYFATHFALLFLHLNKNAHREREG